MLRILLILGLLCGSPPAFTELLQRGSSPPTRSAETLVRLKMSASVTPNPGIPLVRVEGMDSLAVEGSINAGRKHLFLINLKSPRSYFSLKAAGAAGLKIREPEAGSNSLGEVLGQLQLGPTQTKVEGVTLFLSELPAGFRDEFPRVDGVLGTDLLNSYVVSVNFLRKRLELIPRSDEKRLKEIERSATRAPLEIEGGIPTCSWEDWRSDR